MEEQIQILQFRIHRLKALLYQNKLAIKLTQQNPTVFKDLKHPASPDLQRLQEKSKSLQKDLENAESLLRDILFTQASESIRKRLGHQRAIRQETYGY